MSDLAVKLEAREYERWTDLVACEAREGELDASSAALREAIQGRDPQLDREAGLWATFAELEQPWVDECSDEALLAAAFDVLDETEGGLAGLSEFGDMEFGDAEFEGQEGDQGHRSSSAESERSRDEQMLDALVLAVDGRGEARRRRIQRRVRRWGTLALSVAAVLGLLVLAQQGSRRVRQASEGALARPSSAAMAAEFERHVGRAQAEARAVSNSQERPQRPHRDPVADPGSLRPSPSIGLETDDSESIEISAPVSPEPAAEKPRHTPKKVVEKPALEGPEQALIAAQQALVAGDRKRAIVLYTQLIERHSGSQAGRAATVSLGRLLLSEGRHRAALERFEAYLEKPGGALIQEARYGRIRCLRGLGERDVLLQAIGEFELRHPASIHLRRLEQWSAELE